MPSTPDVLHCHCQRIVVMWLVTWQIGNKAYYLCFQIPPAELQIEKKWHPAIDISDHSWQMEKYPTWAVCSRWAFLLLQLLMQLIHTKQYASSYLTEQLMWRWPVPCLSMPSTIIWYHSPTVISLLVEQAPFENINKLTVLIPYMEV